MFPVSLLGKVQLSKGQIKIFRLLSDIQSWKVSEYFYSEMF